MNHFAEIESSSNLQPEEEGRVFLWNVGSHIQGYTVSQPQYTTMWVLIAVKPSRFKCRNDVIDPCGSQILVVKFGVTE